MNRIFPGGLESSTDYGQERALGSLKERSKRTKRKFAVLCVWAWCGNETLITCSRNVFFFFFLHTLVTFVFSTLLFSQRWRTESCSSAWCRRNAMRMTSGSCSLLWDRSRSVASWGDQTDSAEVRHVLYILYLFLHFLKGTYNGKQDSLALLK